MSLPASHPRTRPISAGHLRAFDAVARHLNFRAAAEEMSLTQSAVSRQIQALEDEVGVALFPVSYTHLDVYKRQVYTPASYSTKSPENSTFSSSTQAIVSPRVWPAPGCQI